MRLPKNKRDYPCFNKTLKDLEGEKWLEIPFTEGYYLISNFGRVKALARYIEPVHASYGFWTKDKILSQRCNPQKNHYKGDYTFGTVVTYQFNKQKFRAMTRRLVYEAFLQPITREKMKGKYVYPKDGNGLNSRISNLGLASKSELRKMELAKDRYIPPAFLIDQEKNRQHLQRMNRTKRRVVKQYTLSGKLVGTFSSITLAGRKTGASISCISACASGKLLQVKGSVWRFENDIYNGEFRSNSPAERPVTQYTIDGKKLKSFPSVGEATRQTGINQSNIISCAKKHRKQARGFVWRYAGEPYTGEFKTEYLRRKVAQYEPNGKKLASFSTISAAAEATGSYYEGIRRAIKGELKMSNGFCWKYEGKPATPKMSGKPGAA